VAYLADVFALLPFALRREGEQALPTITKKEKLSMRIVEILATVRMSENFAARVPDGMSDEAILAAVREALNVEAEMSDDPDIDISVSHEVTADGEVILLDDNFEFQWEIERL
jgi:hypothetical protein